MAQFMKENILSRSKTEKLMHLHDLLCIRHQARHGVTQGTKTNQVSAFKGINFQKDTQQKKEMLEKIQGAGRG